MILFVSSGLCVILLLIHSLYFRPFRATGLILLFLLPLSALYGNLYDFRINIFVIPFGHGIQLVHIVGFFFAFYCALTIATHIVEQRDEQGNRTVYYYPLLVWTVVITVFIGLGIEYANFTIKWWTWRPGVTVGKIMLVGVWGWRPLLAVPLLLQFFIDDDFHADIRHIPKLLILGAIFLVSLYFALSAPERRTQELSRVYAMVSGGLFLIFLTADMTRFLKKAFQHPRLRIVVPACTAWFFVFLVWMIFVDRVPILQALTLPLWIVVLLMGRLKGPAIRMEKFMYESPRPLLGRRGNAVP